MEGAKTLAVFISFAFLFAFFLGCTAAEYGQAHPDAQKPFLNGTIVIPPIDFGGGINASGGWNESAVSAGNTTGEGGIDWGEGENRQENNATNATQGNESGENGTLENGANATGGINASGEIVAIRGRESHDIMNGTFALVQTPNATLNIYFIDVGFGNAVLVNKGTFNMLIDAGAQSQGGKVAEFVRAHGIDALNVMVATHDDINSIGGIPTVLDGISAQEIWTNNISYDTAQSDALMQKISEKMLPVKYPVARQWVQVNGLNISVMNPQHQRLKGSSESDAIILRLAYGGFCIVLLDPTVHEIEPSLISSDVGVDECAVVQYFNRGESRGGMYGSSMLVEGRMNALQDVVITVGPSQFDLPSPTSLERFEIHGWDVYRTDLHGTITVSSDGKNHTISKEK